MAEGLLKDKAQKKGLDITVSSAGLAAFSGDCVSENAVRVMNEIGIDIAGHRARAVSPYELSECDYVICMSSSHKAVLSRYIDEEKIVVPQGGISDPYGGDENVYRRCRDELSKFADSFLEKLCDIKIEPMNSESIPAVAGIEKECFSVPWSENALKEELSNENAHFFTASLSKEIIGYIGLHIICDEGYIANVAVKKAHRRKGIGNKLVSKAIDICKEHDCSFITLEVRKSNRSAISLYEKLGFEVCGERKDFYSSPTENALIMTKYFTR